MKTMKINLIIIGAYSSIQGKVVVAISDSYN